MNISESSGLSLEGKLRLPVNLTKRQRIRLKAWVRLGMLLVLAIGIIVILVLIGKRTKLTNEIERARLEAEAAAAAVAAAQAEAEAAEAARLALLPDVDLDAWYMKLANYENLLDEDFAPEVVEIESGQEFDVRAADALKSLMHGARAAGHSVFLCSGYRSYEIQHALYWRHIDEFVLEGMTVEEAHATTKLSVNYPGASEHQLGLAADILEYDGQPMLPEIGGSGLMLWLEENCADYGFIIRYPQDKTHITSISYEPWHLRYVGVEAAQYIMEKGICLEEFLALYESELP